MSTVFDVAAFIVARTGSIQPLKLQKLVYFAQAWSLVRDGQPLFTEEIQAWRYGPVCPALYQRHRGGDAVPIPYPHGNAQSLSVEAQQTVLAVLRIYGRKSSSWLTDLTHREDPWRNARRGVPLDDRGTTEITVEAMRAYYDLDSTEKRAVMASGKQPNPIISFIESMSDDESALIDELTSMDEEPQVAKLTV